MAVEWRSDECVSLFRCVCEVADSARGRFAGMSAVWVLCSAFGGLVWVPLPAFQEARLREFLTSPSGPLPRFLGTWFVVSPWFLSGVVTFSLIGEMGLGLGLVVAAVVTSACCIVGIGWCQKMGLGWAGYPSG